MSHDNKCFLIPFTSFKFVDDLGETQNVRQVRADLNNVFSLLNHLRCTCGPDPDIRCDADCSVCPAAAARAELDSCASGINIDRDRLRELLQSAQRRSHPDQECHACFERGSLRREPPPVSGADSDEQQSLECSEIPKQSRGVAFQHSKELWSKLRSTAANNFKSDGERQAFLSATREADCRLAHNQCFDDLSDDDFAWATENIDPESLPC